jgi:DNA-binding winged helix-turn-helix (wHTH) protein
MGSERTYRLGEWIFAPASNELRRGDERRRLEDRAARTLELLCTRPGETVPHDVMIARIWNGRSQSANSVPVVIGDLRRALDDDARRPRYIETVSKRGYRLIAAAPASRPAAASRWLAASAAMLLAAGAAAWALRSGDPSAVAVTDVVNATGDPGYDPLARATSELIVADLSRRGVTLRRGLVGGADVRLEPKLVLWAGEPTVGLTATEVGTGEVLWSGMARGPGHAIPGNVRRSLAEFAALARKR